MIQRLVALIIGIAILGAVSVRAEDQCGPKTLNATGVWVPAEPWQISDRWGGCQPAIGCVSVGTTATIFRCSSCRENEAGTACTSECSPVDEPCRLGFQRAGNVCAPLLPVKNHSCAFDPAAAPGKRCSIKVVDTKFQCTGRKQKSHSGLRVVADCRTPIVVETGKRTCGGVALTELWEPDPADPSRCSKTREPLKTLPEYRCK